MLTPFLTGLSIVLFLALVFLIKKIFALKQRIEELRFEKGSLAVKYGKMTEQFIPFAEQFPFDEKKFRFLGNPVDGIAFEDDEIIFCEFKTASGKLSEAQKKVKQLVEEKRVKWFEFNMR